MMASRLDKMPTFEQIWICCSTSHTVQAALAAGYKLGIIASTDSHDSKPGSTDDLDACSMNGNVHPSKGGLMAVKALSLTRDRLWSAMQARRVFGTSGPKMGLSFSVNGAQMGAEIQATGAPLIRASATADGGIITRIAILKNNVVVKTCLRGGTNCTYTDDDFNGDAYYYVRATQKSADGETDRAWSSPVWVTDAS